MMMILRMISEKLSGVLTRMLWDTFQFQVRMNHFKKNLECLSFVDLTHILESLGDKLSPAETQVE